MTITRPFAGATRPRPRMDASVLAGTPHRRIATIVGALFIVQMIAFGVGSSFIETYLGHDAGKPILVTGVGLELCAGVAIVAIGFLMYRILRVVDPRWATAYPALRVTEFAVSCFVSVYLLTQLEQVPNHLLWIYLPTGLGGLVLNSLFLRSGLVPRAVSVLGLIGYALLALTVPLDLLGAVDVQSGAGLVMLAPGGVYELLVLPVWLFSAGFRMPYAASSATSRINRDL